MMMKQNFNRRHSPNRRKTLVPARVHAEDRVMSCLVLDVSLEGMRLSVPERVERGTPITIVTMDTAVPALVHWWKDGHAGVRLLDRLDCGTLIALETASDDLAEFR